MSTAVAVVIWWVLIRTEEREMCPNGVVCVTIYAAFLASCIIITCSIGRINPLLFERSVVLISGMDLTEKNSVLTIESLIQ